MTEPSSRHESFDIDRPDRCRPPTHGKTPNSSPSSRMVDIPVRLGVGSTTGTPEAPKVCSTWNWNCSSEPVTSRKSFSRYDPDEASTRQLRFIRPVWTRCMR